MLSDPAQPTAAFGYPPPAGPRLSMAPAATNVRCSFVQGGCVIPRGSIVPLTRDQRRKKTYVASAMDLLLSGMEEAHHQVERMRLLYGDSTVKLAPAEVKVLEHLGGARDFIMGLLQGGASSRDAVRQVFGGDCSRVARVRAVLELVPLSLRGRDDRRVQMCTDACDSLETVLEDLGFGWALREARQREKEVLQRRRVTAAAVATPSSAVGSSWEDSADLVLSAGSGGASLCEPSCDGRAKEDEAEASNKSKCRDLWRRAAAAAIAASKAAQTNDRGDSSEDEGEELPPHFREGLPTIDPSDPMYAQFFDPVSDAMAHEMTARTDPAANHGRFSVSLCFHPVADDPSAAVGDLESSHAQSLAHKRLSTDRVHPDDQWNCTVVADSWATVAEVSGEEDAADCCHAGSRSPADEAAGDNAWKLASDATGTSRDSAADADRAAGDTDVANAEAPLEAHGPVVGSDAKGSDGDCVEEAAIVGGADDVSSEENSYRFNVRKIFAHYVGASAMSTGQGLQLSKFRRFLRDGGLLRDVDAEDDVSLNSIAAALGGPAPHAAPSTGKAKKPNIRTPLKEPLLSKAEADLIHIKAAGEKRDLQQAQRTLTVDAFSTALELVALQCFSKECSSSGNDTRKAFRTLCDTVLAPLEDSLPGGRAVSEALEWMRHPDVAALLRRNTSAVSGMFEYYALEKYSAAPYQKGHWTVNVLSIFAGQVKLSSELSHQALHALFVDCSCYDAASHVAAEEYKLSYAGFKLLLVSIALKVLHKSKLEPPERVAAFLSHVCTALDGRVSLHFQRVPLGSKAPAAGRLPRQRNAAPPSPHSPPPATIAGIAKSLAASHRYASRLAAGVPRAGTAPSTAASPRSPRSTAQAVPPSPRRPDTQGVHGVRGARIPRV